MYKRLMKFLEKNNSLNENQFGFRNNRSTIQATMLIADKIQRALEEKNILWHILRSEQSISYSGPQNPFKKT